MFLADKHRQILLVILNSCKAHAIIPSWSMRYISFLTYYYDTANRKPQFEVRRLPFDVTRIFNFSNASFLPQPQWQASRRLTAKAIWKEPFSRKKGDFGYKWLKNCTTIAVDK